MDWIGLIVKLISLCLEKNDRKTVRNRIRQGGFFVKAALRGEAHDLGLKRKKARRFVRDGLDFVGSLTDRDIDEMLDAAESRSR